MQQEPYYNIRIPATIVDDFKLLHQHLPQPSFVHIVFDNLLVDLFSLPPVHVCNHIVCVFFCSLIVLVTRFKSYPFATPGFSFPAVQVKSGINRTKERNLDFFPFLAIIMFIKRVNNSMFS